MKCSECFILRMRAEFLWLPVYQFLTTKGGAEVREGGSDWLLLFCNKNYLHFTIHIYFCISALPHLRTSALLFFGQCCFHFHPSLNGYLLRPDLRIALR